MAERPLAPLIERAELVDFDGEANPPSVLKDRAVVPIDADAADRCAPDIPLVEETARVLTGVDTLLENDRPEVEVEPELVLLCEEEFCR